MLSINTSRPDAGPDGSLTAPAGALTDPGRPLSVEAR